MSRILYSLLYLAFLSMLTACGTIVNLVSDQIVLRGSGELASEERELPGFSAVHVNSSIDVTIETGPEQRVVASADDNILPYLRTEVEGDTLIVDLGEEDDNITIIDMEHPATVAITASAIEELVVNSSGNITAEALTGEQVAVQTNSSGDIDVGAVSANSLRIITNSSGDVTIDGLEATALDATLNSSGNVDIAGEVQSQNVQLTSSGNYEAAELRSASASAQISSSGNATLWVTESLRGETNSSGDIRYYGSPPDVRGEVTALGGR